MKTDEVFDLYPEVDAIWVRRCENVRYISGFVGGDSELLLTSDKNILITDARYITQAKNECPEWIIIDHEGERFKCLNNLCNENKVNVLGTEERGVSLREYRMLKELKPTWKLSNVDLDRFREIKTENEIDNIREACRIADDALQSILPLIEVGKTEKELRIALEKAMLDQGSEQRSFETIVASGKRSALPHGYATNKELCEGDFVTFDFGAMYNGYCSDITRTFIMGNASEKQCRLYHAVLEAQESALELVTTGRSANEIDAHARKILAEYDVAEYFTHSTGHGVGLEIHENPNLSPTNESILQAGMVVTVEPGIYFPDYGGLRIEDTVVVRNEQPEILTKFPKKLFEL